MSQNDPTVQRTELAALRDQGILTDAEYADAVSRVQQGATPAQALAQTTSRSVDEAQAALDRVRTDVATTTADVDTAEQALADAAAAGHNAEPSEVYDPAAAHAAGAPPGTPPEEVK